MIYVAAMAYSDVVLIQQIQRKTDGKTPLLLRDIISEIGMSERTAQRSLNRLIQNGQISRTGRGKSAGYVYEVLDDSSSS